MTNNYKKGFTLVEIIVVLVIIAILAVFLIPALMGYIDEAREKATITLARNTYAEVNGVLQSPSKSSKSAYFLINRWVASENSNHTITYHGPQDNSVTTPSSGSYHDHAKNAIRSLMGEEPLQFGYRMFFVETSPGMYMIERMEVFYKTPSKASESATKPDISFGNVK